MRLHDAPYGQVGQPPPQGGKRQVEVHHEAAAAQVPHGGRAVDGAAAGRDDTAFAMHAEQMAFFEAAEGLRPELIEQGLQAAAFVRLDEQVGVEKIA